MHTITARNVNDAYRRGLALLMHRGTRVPSRNGPVLRLAVPVTTVYRQPRERVLFDAQRNANPFFHLFESLWMLDGRHDVLTLAQFNPRMREFSDDGSIFHGAYGHRWRHWPMHAYRNGSATADKDLFLNTSGLPLWYIYTTTEQLQSSGEYPGFDQLVQVIAMLRKNPQSRRAVISMWDPIRDLGADSLDIPCNDTIKVSVTSGVLDIQVFCRSNDLVWGCYGANVVQFSMLQEYLAGMLDLPVGQYWQISCDFHAYLERPYRLDKFYPLEHTSFHNPYEHDDLRSIVPCQLIDNRETFDAELRVFMETLDPTTEHTLESLITIQDSFRNRFFIRVALPMARAWEAVREQNYRQALIILASGQALNPADNDWLLAAEEWISRKIDRSPEVPIPITGALDEDQSHG